MRPRRSTLALLYISGLVLLYSALAGCEGAAPAPSAPQVQQVIINPPPSTPTTPTPAPE